MSIPSRSALAACLALGATAALASPHNYGEVQVRIDRGGKVESCELLKSSGSKAMDDKALKACKDEWQFPAPAGSEGGTVIMPVKPIKAVD